METDKQKFSWGKVIIVSLAHLIHDVFTSFLPPVLPLLIDKFSLSYLNSSILNRNSCFFISILESKRH